MSEPTLEMLGERLERLERQNRRLKLGVLGVLVLMGSLVLMGAAAPPKVVEAEKFVLRDDQGRERAVLDTSADRSGFRLYDAAGKKRTAIELGEISLYNENETQRINLGVERVDEGNGAAMGVLDAKGKTRIGLLTCQMGPALYINNVEEQTRAIMGMMPAGIFADRSTLPPGVKPGADPADQMTALGGEQDPHIFLLDAKGRIVRQWPPPARTALPGAHH